MKKKQLPKVYFSVKDITKENLEKWDKAQIDKARKEMIIIDESYSLAPSWCSGSISLLQSEGLRSIRKDGII